MENYNPWNLRKPIHRIKSLGEGVKTLISDYPQWVLYVRLDRRFPCVSCLNEATGGARLTGSCDTCWGLGFKTSAQIVAMHRNTARGEPRPAVGAAGLTQGEPGFILNEQTVFITAKNTYPQVGDLILTCEWDKDPLEFTTGRTPRPVSIHLYYQISQVLERVDRQVAWFEIGVMQEEAVPKTVLSRILKKTSDFQVLPPRF